MLQWTVSRDIGILGGTAMTVAVCELLDSFEALPEPEKHLAIVELLRRATSSGDLPETTLQGAADALFVALDSAESGNGHAQR